jgi:hypothetical protein
VKNYPLDRWVETHDFFWVFMLDKIQTTLEFHGSLEPLRNEDRFRQWMSSVYRKEWVVYCKPPFKTPAHVVECLGRYTHRVAISNQRILRAEDELITFRWRDYRDGNRQKEMTLTADEFIRRFLMHVLPMGFTRIRHYGVLSPRNRKTKLALCRTLTKTKCIPVPKLSAVELFRQLTGKDFMLCPSCGVGHLMRAAPISKIT